MNAPLQVGFQRGVAPTLLVVAVLEALVTGVAVVFGVHPAILLFMVPGAAVVAAWGLQCRGTALTVDSDGIAGQAGRLSWSEVEDITIGQRHALVVTGGGRQVTASLALLDTPARTIFARIEREWGRPVPAPARTRGLGLG